MGRNTDKVIGTKARIAARSYETDYDRTNPPAASDEKKDYRSARKRAVRYWYVKSGCGYRAEVVGPFHSRLYGTCGFGTNKIRAKARLKSNLANNYGFLGTMLLTDKDEADNVSMSAAEIWHRANNAEREALENADERPINAMECIGSAGQ